MTTTNAQRQRAYRQRHLKDTGNDYEMLERINMMVSFSAKENLRRLAFHYGVTQRAVLEQIINEATNHAIKTMDGQQRNDFFDMKPALRSNKGGEPTNRQQRPVELTDRDRSE